MGDAAGVIVEGSLGGKPGVSLPGGEPPADLVIHDVSEGTGAPVDPGATVTAHSVGLGWSTGVVDPAGRGVAFLTSSAKDGKIAVRLQSFGTRTPEAELRRLIGAWRKAGSPSFEELRISVRFTRARPRAWRTFKRGSSWITFDWVPLQ